MKTHISILAALVAASMSYQAQAETVSQSIDNLFEQGQTHGLVRYRYEFVDQEGVAKNANASTALARLNYTTGAIAGINALVEVDHVQIIGNELYNNSYNGLSQYALVADPDGTEINQAALKYTSEQLLFTAGRQRINLDDQRFVGGVAWRQNEQTYDGYRLVYKPNAAFSLDVSAIYNVNRIFGEDSPNSDLDGDVYLLNAGYQLAENHKVSVFGYQYDFTNAAALSSQTVGVRFSGQLTQSIKYTASYAQQSDYGDNPNDYSADYILLELKGAINSIGWSAGYEQLGSDNNVGFSTPLATGHKFQGFADKFLSTPANGIEDFYFGVNTKVKGVKLTAMYHDFSSDAHSEDYGTELDLSAQYALNEKSSVLLKYALYNAQDFATDTDKAWVMFTYKF